VAVWSELVTITSYVVELALELDPVQTQIMKKALQHVHTQQNSNCRSKPSPIKEEECDTVARERHGKASKDRFLEEHEGQLLMRKRQCPKTKIRCCVGNSAKNILNGLDDLVDHDLVKLELTTVSVATTLTLLFIKGGMAFVLLVILYMQNANKKNEGHAALDEEEGEGGGHGHGGEFKLDEVVIHQIIETIEYVLGTVSHTASYLRLWALSLAHQQLSLVFFQKTILGGLSMSFPANGIALFFLYGAWFGTTVGVLLGMDVLECFLHDLRLHWVEFQSKFYNVGGDGYQFAPYSHQAVLAPKAD
jgi:hypothetical protein